MGSFFSRLFLISVPLVMGLVFIVLGIRNHSLGKQSEDWPTVQGSLVSESSSRQKKKKRIHVFYEYQVNGTPYKNSRVNFRDDKASKKKYVISTISAMHSRFIINLTIRNNRYLNQVPAPGA